MAKPCFRQHHHPESNAFDCLKMIPKETLIQIKGNKFFMKETKKFYNRKNRNTRKQLLRKETNGLDI